MESVLCNIPVSTPIKILIDILVSSARAFMNTHKGMWSLVTFKLQAAIHIWESKKYSFGFSHDEVNKNRIIDGLGLARHMIMENKQGDVSMQILIIHTVSINRSV